MKKLLFSNRKFFTPLTSFLPPLFFLENSLWSDIWLYQEKSSNKKRGGKKLVRGVKNFWFVKYEYSAFICTKNQQKIFRTHWNHLNCADPWVRYVLEHLLQKMWFCAELSAKTLENYCHGAVSGEVGQQNWAFLMEVLLHIEVPRLARRSSPQLAEVTPAPRLRPTHSHALGAKMTWVLNLGGLSPVTV